MINGALQGLCRDGLWSKALFKPQRLRRFFPSLALCTNASSVMSIERNDSSSTSTCAIRYWSASRSMAGASSSSGTISTNCLSYASASTLAAFHAFTSHWADTGSPSSMANAAPPSRSVGVQCARRNAPSRLHEGPVGSNAHVASSNPCSTRHAASASSDSKASIPSGDEAPPSPS